MMAAVTLIISSELKQAEEKEMLLLLFPKIFIVLDCFSGNLRICFILLFKNSLC